MSHHYKYVALFGNGLSVDYSNVLVLNISFFISKIMKISEDMNIPGYTLDTEVLRFF